MLEVYAWSPQCRSTSGEDDKTALVDGASAISHWLSVIINSEPKKLPVQY